MSKDILADLQAAGATLYLNQEQQIQTLKMENQRLREALEQYADVTNWNALREDRDEPRDWWVLWGNGYDLARKSLKM